VQQVRGLHHVTAIAGPAQENLDFYAGVLGMRLVKKSVNQDDPGTYHLFYADAEGHPGTDLTFFPWAQMAAGRDGYGLSVEVSLAVPPGSLVFWRARLERYGRKILPIETRFGQRALPFTAEGFLMSFSLPNFFFHATTAYDILRHKGAPLGKRDFMGRLKLKG
jgi:glyoxalase family protein